MTRSWIIALLATVPTSLAQEDCDTRGVNAGVTQITFGEQASGPSSETRLVKSNLGGLGGFFTYPTQIPNTCDIGNNALGCYELNALQDREILFQNVGDLDGTTLNLQIKNYTKYTPETFGEGSYSVLPLEGARQNRINGQFGQVNVGANSSVLLQFAILNDNTGQPVVLPGFTIVMYDFDTGRLPAGRTGDFLSIEYAVVCDAVSVGISDSLYGPNVPSTIILNRDTAMPYKPRYPNDQLCDRDAGIGTSPGNCWTGTSAPGCNAVHATTFGIVQDNPSDPIVMTNLQKARSFVMFFQDRSAFNITVGATGEEYGRNFMFAGVNLLPPCPPPPAGGPSPPPSPPPFPPPFPPTYDHVSARRDPHFTFAHGGHADFKGEDGAVYNLVSAKNVSFNAKFVYDDFHLPRKLVHGSYMGAVYWTFRTYCPKCDNWGPKRRPRIITVMFNASAKQPNPVVVRESGKPEPFYVYDGAGTWRADNVMVSVHGHGSTAVVSDGRWKFSASSKEFPNPTANPGKYLLHVNVDTLYDADKDVVAPHGIIGQSYDGDKVGVDGAQDDYRNAGSEMSTAAQAEGAIEGAAADYKVASPFATDFKYSRFDAVSASPRDLSTLKGKRVPLVPGHAAGAGTLPDPESSIASSGSVEDDEVSADAITKSINRIHPQLSN